MPVPFLIPAAIQIATEFFPMLATKIAGPRAAEVATTVVATAAAAAGLPPDTDVKQIIAKVKASDVASEQLRFQFEQLNQQEHEATLADRQDARRYQVAVGPDGRTRGNYMLIGVSCGLIACIFVASVPYLSDLIGASTVEGRPVDPALLALVTTVAGALLKMLSDAFAFEFGSSRGSREKDTQLADFRQALVDVGKDNRQAATEIIREQQQQSAGIAQQAIKATDQVVTAGAEAIAAGAAAAQNLVTSVLRRDFVGDLVKGQI